MNKFHSMLYNNIGVQQNRLEYHHFHKKIIRIEYQFKVNEESVHSTNKVSETINHICIDTHRCSCKTIPLKRLQNQISSEPYYRQSYVKV